jgi:hypothetical protein
MLVFDLKSVLTRLTTRFVAGNFANTNQILRTGDVEFNNLNFNQIYHDSAVSRDDMASIHNMRMSEVVVPQRLDLVPLSYVVCRTIHEERYLRRLLGPGSWPYNFVVEKGGSIFFRWAILITEIYTRNGELYLEFSSPRYGTKPTYEVRITCGDQQQLFEVAPPRGRFPTIVNPDPHAIWKIEIEGCTAYEGIVPATPLVA